MDRAIEAIVAILVAVLTVIAIAASAAMIVVYFAGEASSEENHHPPQDQQLHAMFYSNWMRPDDQTKSCCGKGDCYPTEIRIIEGKVYARRREDGKYLFVHPDKIEKRRDSPDGLNHLCAPTPAPSQLPDSLVYCFAFGAGL